MAQVALLEREVLVAERELLDVDADDLEADGGQEGREHVAVAADHHDLRA